MKIIYVSSPRSGKRKDTEKYVKQCCEFVVQSGNIPVSPIINGTLYENEVDVEKANETGKILLGKCDEIWVFGEFLSSEMLKEITWALERKIPRKGFWGAEVITG